MKHVSLDGYDEHIKRFVRSLAASPEGILLELDGRPVAFLVGPARIARARHDPESWTDEKNDRRCDLIDKEIDGSLTAVERLELTELEEELLDYRDHLAPIPIAQSRELHQQLLQLARKATP